MLLRNQQLHAIVNFHSLSFFKLWILWQFPFQRNIGYLYPWKRHIAAKNACICSELDLKNLQGICTDGAPAMTGNQEGFVTRFWDYVSSKYDNKELINLHCIIHQEALCAKSVSSNTILKDVNRIILFIRTNALHHQQFWEILCSNETSAEDILYNSAVCWLSIGETSHCVLQLQKEIVKYYLTKARSVPAQQRLSHVAWFSGGFSYPS